MVPYSWFVNLEQADRPIRLADAKNMQRMGWIVDGPSSTNPDGLPVGFARDVDPVRGDALGLTCAACHTGQVNYHGSAVRIDGGQSLGDLEQLQNALLASLQTTLADNAKFQRFADKVLGPGADSTSLATLQAQLEDKAAWWAARVARSRGLSPHGPSRTDAFTIIGNEVVCRMLGVAANCVTPVAPTEFPYLWNTPDFEWVQYNSSVHSPIGRNVGEVTGVFAEASIDPNGVASTANIPNMDTLENSLKLLHAPAWPENIFGRINQERAAAGKVLFDSACASCHTEDPQPRTPPNAYGVTFAQVNFSTPLSVLGTDPSAAMMFATRRADPGPWTAIAQAQGLIGPDGKAPVAALLSISGTMIIQRFFAAAQLTPMQELYYLGFRESRTPTVAQITTYKARPLKGVAFTAPYLHNGSVPSLYQLLLPSAQRVKQFYVGPKQEFDPEVVGYETSEEDNSVLIDTTLPGTRTPVTSSAPTSPMTSALRSSST